MYYLKHEQECSNSILNSRRIFLSVYSYPFTLKLAQQTYSDKLGDKTSQEYLQLKKQLIDGVRDGHLKFRTSWIQFHCFSEFQNDNDQSTVESLLSGHLRDLASVRLEGVSA